MSLKNWTVTFKSISKEKGGYLGYTSYLGDNNHRNHKAEDHKILDLGICNKKTYVENQKILDKMNYQKILKGEGGRPSTNLGVSVVISLPIQINDDKKLKNYTNELIREYYKDLCKMNKLNYNKQSFASYKKLVFANVHKKDTGSQTQINLTLPHYLPNVIQQKKIEKGVISDKEIITPKLSIKKIDMSQKKYSYLMKSLNNELAFKKLGLDYRTYEIKNPTKSKKRKKLSTVKTEDLNKKLEDVEKKLKQIDTAKAKMQNVSEQIEVKAFRLNENMKKFNEMKIEDKTLNKYLDRLNTKLEKNMSNEEIQKSIDLIKNRQEKVLEYHDIDEELDISFDGF